MLVYGLTLANGSSISNMAVSGGNSFPLTPIAGALFFLTTDNSLYLFNGSIWTSLGGGSPSSGNFVVVPFSYNTPSPLNVLMMTAGKMILESSIIIEVPFSGGVAPTLTIGDAGDVDRFMTAADNDPTVATTFKTTPSYKYASTTQVTLTITPNGSSAGNGFAVLTIEL